MVSGDVDHMTALLQHKRSQKVLPHLHHQQRLWSSHRLRGVQPKTSSKEEAKPFLQDVNFPELSNVDLSFHNPNIEVSIEAVDGPQAELEMDLAKEGHSDWSLSTPGWMETRSLFWPLLWEFPGSKHGQRHGSPQNMLEDHEQKPGGENSGHSGAAGDQGSHLSQTWDSMDDYDVDSCQRWLSCKNDFLQTYLRQALAELPGCPCSYPSEVVYGAVGIFDERLQRPFRWRDASGPKERLGVYRAAAHTCVRSTSFRGSPTLAAQQCCYDHSLRLLTRGSGAGVPDLISSDFSPELHRKVDVLPWLLCKGDWSRFHVGRPPNNSLRCAENPPEEEFARQLEEAREY